MKKTPLFALILAFLVFSLAGVAYSWQGRMAGMGDPYGLIMDESDFLIHPAKIADGKGVNIYGNYRFNYTDVMDWNYTQDFFNPGGTLAGHFPFRGSGNEQEHSALLGAAFPLGPGRMGLFFEYAGKRGDYDGKGNALDFGGPFLNRYSLDSDLDAFDLRLLYGLPIGGFKLGGEIQLAYRQEKNKTFYNGEIFGFPLTLTNYTVGDNVPVANLFPFMFPYDSKYWEALFKGSLKGGIGPVKIAFTAWGGIIFGGDNSLDFVATSSFPFLNGSVKMDGDVKGWRVGGDLWLRYALAKDFSFPFLLKIVYQKKTRDGDGLGVDALAPDSFEYKNKERNFQVEAGGGIDKELAKGARIAAGIYYGFLQNKSDFFFMDTFLGGSVNYNHSKYPDQTEHRVILKLAGEKEISPMFVMRMGLNFFYGWVKEDLNFSTDSSGDVNKSSLDGSRWGIGASLGGTVKFQRFSFEPFIGGGYQRLNLSGSGFDLGVFGVTDRDKLRKEWSIGGGASVKF